MQDLSDGPHPLRSPVSGPDEWRRPGGHRAPSAHFCAGLGIHRLAVDCVLTRQSEVRKLSPASIPELAPEKTSFCTFLLGAEADI
jgi:hypothetical protein